MADSNYILLKAAVGANRQALALVFKAFSNGDENMAWFVNFALYGFEQNNLSRYAEEAQLDAQTADAINRRLFQLRVLMDVAYIRGNLQSRGNMREISPDARALADSVYTQSNGTEESMLTLIDEAYNS